MRQLGLAGSPERGQVGEELGVEEPLLEGALRHCEEEEEEGAQDQALQQAYEDHVALPGGLLLLFIC